MTEEAQLATRIAAWKLTASNSRTSIADGPSCSASATSITTVISNTAIGSAASDRPRGTKRKTEEEYKVVPDPAFPAFKEVRKLATREAKVKNHLAQMTKCLEEKSIPRGLSINIKPIFGQNQPEFLASWNSACTEFSNSLMIMLGERAHKELENLKIQIQSKTEAMNEILKEKTAIDKVADYLKTVINKESPEHKKARLENSRPAKKARYTQPNRRQRGPPRTKKTTESEEDLLHLIRQIKQRRRR